MKKVVVKVQEVDYGWRKIIVLLESMDKKIDLLIAV